MNIDKEKHIVLIGFKSVGKTVVGKRLAKELGRAFLDLDAAVERKYGKGVGCREIVEKEGEAYFRKLESGALQDVLSTNESVILALGGGAAMSFENQELLKDQIVVLISGSKDVLFERIMRRGRPPFFPQGMDDRDAFEKLYNEREPVYEKLATVTVKSAGGVAATAEEIIKILNLKS